MARFKMCVCGKKSLAARRDLCASCLDDYGTNKELWPEWLKFAVKDTQRAYDHERNHDEFEQWDKFNYEEKMIRPGYHGEKKWKAGETDEVVDLEAALNKLNKNQRTALTLRSEGYNHQEVADQMGVSLRSAKEYALTGKALMLKLLG